MPRHFNKCKRRRSRYQVLAVYARRWAEPHSLDSFIVCVRQDCLNVRSCLDDSFVRWLLKFCVCTCIFMGKFPAKLEDIASSLPIAHYITSIEFNSKTRTFNAEMSTSAQFSNQKHRCIISLTYQIAYLL